MTSESHQYINNINTYIFENVYLCTQWKFSCILTLSRIHIPIITSSSTTNILFSICLAYIRVVCAISLLSVIERALAIIFNSNNRYDHCEIIKISVFLPVQSEMRIVYWTLDKFSFIPILLSCHSLIWLFSLSIVNCYSRITGNLR